MKYRQFRKYTLVVVTVTVALLASYGLILYTLLSDSLFQVGLLQQSLSASIEGTQQAQSIYSQLSKTRAILILGIFSVPYVVLIGIFVNSLVKHNWRHSQWKQQARKFQSLLDILPTASILSDKNGHVVLCNSTSAQLMNSERSLLMGKNLSDLFSLDIQQLAELENETSLSIETELTFGTDLVVINLSIKKISFDGEEHFLVTANNVSELVSDKQELKKQRDKLRRMSISDELTKIANRRRFDEFFSDSHARSQRDMKSLSLLLIDIDCFKQYNDHYGHSQGDKALKTVARTLKQQFKRRVDLCARVGGEEFACVLNGSDISNAKEMAEELRAAIEELNIPHHYSSAAKYVTVSVGVACFEPAVQSLTGFQLFDQADEALYDAKSEGRNCVCTYTCAQSQLSLLDKQASAEIVRFDQSLKTKN